MAILAWPAQGLELQMTSVFDPLRLGPVALDVLASGRATPSALAARQRSRLVALLNAAVRGSVLYRERLQGRAPSAWPLHALPKVSRGELMARFDDWVTDPELKLAELRAFTADPGRSHSSVMTWATRWRCTPNRAPAARRCP